MTILAVWRQIASSIGPGHDRGHIPAAFGARSKHREHVRSVVSYRDGVLEMGRKAPIGCHHTPSVLELFGLGSPGVDHRLHCEDRSEEHTSELPSRPYL